MLFGAMYYELEDYRARGWAFFLTFGAYCLLFFLGAKSATKASCMGRKKLKEAKVALPPSPVEGQGRWVWQPAVPDVLVAPRDGENEHVIGAGDKSVQSYSRLSEY